MLKFPDPERSIMVTCLVYLTSCPCDVMRLDSLILTGARDIAALTKPSGQKHGRGGRAGRSRPAFTGLTSAWTRYVTKTINPGRHWWIIINNIVGQTRGVKSEAKLRLTHKPPGDRFQAPPLLFGELLFQASLRMMSTYPPPSCLYPSDSKLKPLRQQLLSGGKDGTAAFRSGLWFGGYDRLKCPKQSQKPLLLRLERLTSVVMARGNGPRTPIEPTPPIAVTPPGLTFDPAGEALRPNFYTFPSFPSEGFVKPARTSRPPSEMPTLRFHLCSFWSLKSWTPLDAGVFFTAPL